MIKKRLFIVGNGFDRYHGIHSGYQDFCDYIKIHDRHLSEILDQYFDERNLWSDFEGSLADLDAEQVKDYARNFLEPSSGEEWSDSYNHDYQYEIEQIVDALTNILSRRLTSWVLQLKIPSMYDNIPKLDFIDKNGLFLSFNYTPTLERIYSIAEKDILYIHRKAVDNNSNLILGHAWNPKKYKGHYKRDFDATDDIRLIEGEDLILDYFKKTYKPTVKLIRENGIFFEHLTSIEEIYVMGHSLRDVDMGYFRKIVRSIDTNKVDWYISYKKEEDKFHHQETMQHFGIKKDLVHLDDIKDLGKNHTNVKLL